MYGTITAFRGAHVKIIWQLNYIRGNPYQWNRPFLGIHFATFSNSWLNQFCTLASFSSPSPFLFFYHSPSFFFFAKHFDSFGSGFALSGCDSFWWKVDAVFGQSHLAFFFGFSSLLFVQGSWITFLYFFFLGGERVWFSSTGAKGGKWKTGSKWSARRKALKGGGPRWSLSLILPKNSSLSFLKL